MAIDVKAAIEDLIRDILGNREAAAAYVADPEGTLAEVGVTGAEISAADIRAAVEEACADLDLSPQVQSALNAYVASTPPPPSSAPSSAPAAPPAAAPPTQPPMEVVQQHLNYVTYVSYEGDESITNNIDNSTYVDQSSDINVDVGDHNDGDITIDVENVSASGDGAVAAGDTVENAQTGDGGVLIDGDNDGGIATGDGSAATGYDSDGNAINTGEFTGVQNTGDGDVNAVVGDGNTAIVDSDVDDTSIVSGDVGGDVVSIGDIDDSAVNFGDGATTGNVSDLDSDSGDINVGQGQGGGIVQVDTDDTAAAQGGNAFGDVDDSAVNTGSGEATNVSDLDDGSAAVVGDGAATGSDINDAFNNNTDSNLEQGDGDLTFEPAVVLDPELPEEFVGE